jgi:hypothetical protein
MRIVDPPLSFLLLLILPYFIRFGKRKLPLFIDIFSILGYNIFRNFCGGDTAKGGNDD